MRNKKITVGLPYIDEEIYIGRKMLDFVISKIKSRKYDKHYLIIDANAKKDRKEYFDKLIKELNIVDCIVLKPTPNHKSLKKCEKIISRLIDTRASRKSCLISIGGGYVSDVTGYVASNYMRGIGFVQISTTLMSMVDAVIGKVAINFGAHKNLLGSFYSPKYVFSDLDFLDSLVPEEKKIGLSEVWKHALIVRDMEMVHKVEQYLLDPSDSYYVDFIWFSMKVKSSCVVPDFDDRKGFHKALSLGHTFANYLEKKPNMRHGVAVMYGIFFVALLSKRIGKLSLKTFDRIVRTAKLFEKDIGLLKEIQGELLVEDVLESFHSDKINDNNSLSFVLPTNDGYCICKNRSQAVVVDAVIEFKEIDL